MGSCISVTARGTCNVLKGAVRCFCGCVYSLTHAAFWHVTMSLICRNLPLLLGSAFIGSGLGYQIWIWMQTSSDGMMAYGTTYLRGATNMYDSFNSSEYIKFG